MVCIYGSMPQLSLFFFAHFLISYHADCVRLTPKLPNYYKASKIITCTTNKPEGFAVDDVEA